MGKLRQVIAELKWFFIICTLILLTGLVCSFYQTCNIYRNSNYLVAIAQKQDNGRVANQIYVSFTYKNFRYEEAATYYGSKPTLGQKYFIVVNEENISQSVLLANCPVPDSLEIPKNGWKKMPIPAFQKEVDAYFEENLNSGIYKLFPKCD